MPHSSMISTTACAVALILWHRQSYAEGVNAAGCGESSVSEGHSRQNSCLLQSASSVGTGRYVKEAAAELRKPHRHGSSGEEHLKPKTSQLSEKEQPEPERKPNTKLVMSKSSKKASVKSAAGSRSSRANATAVPQQSESVDFDEAELSSDDMEVLPDENLEIEEVDPSKAVPAPSSSQSKDADVELDEASSTRAVPIPSPSPLKKSNGTSGKKDKEELVSDGEVEAGEEDTVESQASFEPDHKNCNPACTWKCETPSCDQNCEPECMAPKCETRCKALNTTGCVMDCQEPTCYTVCPKTMCNGNKCPVCKTTCSKPLCRLKCPQRQDCKSICATPSCKWHCSKPAMCPAPKCKLECEQPTKCKGGIHHKLPDLKKGEFKVGSFEAPMNMGPNTVPADTVSGECGCSVPITTSPCTCDEETPVTEVRDKVTDGNKKVWEVVSQTGGDSNDDSDGEYYSGVEAGTPVTMPVTVERSAEEAGYTTSHQVHMPVLAQKAANMRRLRDETGFQNEPV